MMKYADEFKSQALTMMEADGVSKTCEAMKITKATLYKWRNEVKSGAGKTAAPKTQKTRAAAKKTAAKIRKPRAAKADTDAAAKARALLAEDDGLTDKLTQLVAENSRLRERNEKLKQALTALLD